MMIRSRAFFAAALGLLASSLVAFPAKSESVPAEGQRFSASATGTAVYIGALPPDVEHLAVRAGFSGATVSAAGRILITHDEFGGLVAAGGAGRHAEARGRGLDVNGLVVAGAAEAAAPPTPAPVADEGRLVDVPKVASASLGRGEAAPAWSNDACLANGPLSFGSGRALGVVMPVAAIDAARSDATIALRPLGDTLSVVAEARQGTATVTLLPGTPEQTTVEVLGETVLRARADGNHGGATLEYAAVGTDPAAPFLRITRGKEVTQLTSQQVFGGGVKLAQTPVMELRIGEQPRGFDTTGGSPPFVGAEGTAASAVVDLLRVQLLTGGHGEALDVRIGHMEVEVTAPAGGVRCPVSTSNKHGPTSAYGDTESHASSGGPAGRRHLCSRRRCPGGGSQPCDASTSPWSSSSGARAFPSDSIKPRPHDHSLRNARLPWRIEACRSWRPSPDPRSLGGQSRSVQPKPSCRR